MSTFGMPPPPPNKGKSKKKVKKSPNRGGPSGKPRKSPNRHQKKSPNRAPLPRRRLSVAGGGSDAAAADLEAYRLDGGLNESGGGPDARVEMKSPSSLLNDPVAAAAAATAAVASEADVVKAYAALSKVGFVPYGQSKVNQDRALCVKPLNGAADMSLFAVFDGHGLVGHDASQFVVDHLVEELTKEPLDVECEGSIEKALEDAFVAVNTRLVRSPIDASFSGTTATLALLAGSVLFTANAGDSRTVLVSEKSKNKLVARAVTRDHKPDDPVEKKRIVESNGRVHPLMSYGEPIGPPRVWIMQQDVPGLAMSRSIGDAVAQSVGVLPNPEIQRIQLSPSDKRLILASDGVWEFISDQEASDIIAKVRDPTRACELLVRESTRRWKAEESVIDDITAVVVNIHVK